ncbi:MAG: hypothetical protein VB091_10915 [Christensenella sp.]|nr:hypothetical protein [Christensenella sp.]
MVRAYCNIIGSRERDYVGNSLGLNVTREMTIFSGGAGLPYTEEVIRVSRDVFQLYGGKISYTSGAFSSVMRSVAGQAFVCYGISQKQAVGRDSQFTQIYIVPREDLLDGTVYIQEVLGRNFVQEEAVHRATRPTNEEIFATTSYSRSEVNQLSEQRRRVLMHAVTLLCNGRKVLLVERDRAYQNDFFRPLLRELYELIPDGHRYQIDVTTGRCLDDLDRLSSAQLIVTSQPYGGTLERQQLILEDDELTVRIPDTRFWPSVMPTPDGRNEFTPPAEKPNMTPYTKEWSIQDNAQRDELSRHNEFMTKTIQTDYVKLMECMDEEKSFWWKLPRFEKSIASFQQLREWHESTYILNMESYNAQFCARLPALLSLNGGVEELYFDLMQEKIPDDIRRRHLAYIRIRLHNFALSEADFEALEKNYRDCDQAWKLVLFFTRQIAEYTTKIISRVDTDISRIRAKTNDFIENIVQLHQSTANLIAETQN